MNSLKTYKKSVVIRNIIISTVVLLLLSALCAVYVLREDMMTFSYDERVIFTFSVMAFLLLGGLYGYYVSSIVFTILFILTLIFNSAEAFKMVIYMVAMFGFALFGQYRWFATKIKTAIAAFIMLVTVSFLEMFCMSIVALKQYSLYAAQDFHMCFLRNAIVIFGIAFALYFFFNKAPDTFKYPFPLSLTYTSFYQDDKELQKGFRKTRVSYKITAILISLEVILGISVAGFMVVLFPDLKSIMLDSVKRTEITQDAESLLGSEEFERNFDDITFILDASAMSYDIKMLLLMLCVGVPIAAIANFYTKVYIGAPLGKMSDFMEEYARAEGSKKLEVGRKVDNIVVRSHDEIRVVNDAIKETVYAIEAYIGKINEEYELEKELEVAKKSSEAKSSFLSNMSHEIRTPINAVLGMNEMILRESDQKEVIKYAENIRSAGYNLLGLVNDILDFSKIEAGKMEIIPVEYECASVINDLVNMVRKRAEDKGLEVIIKTDSTMPHLLYGDEIRIKQVITNILSNAVKYTEKGSITLDVQNKYQDEEKVIIHVTVSDTGIGIKQEDLPKLFESFERIEERRNRTIEGTGLGMNITQNLLVMMGSKLQVESVYGQGSTFSFDLEQKIVDDTPIGDFEEALKRSVAARKIYHESFTAPDAHILVVDDTKINLSVIENLLKKTLLQIDTAESGMECLEKLRQKKYDLVFLDHRMPEMDGIETLEKITEEGIISREETAVIALTANAVSGSREFYLGAGFDDYISKPVDPIHLEEVILSYLLPKGLAKVANIESDEVSSKEGTPDWIRSIPSLDVQNGLEKCGCAEGYEDAVRVYEESAKDNLKAIESSFDKGDYETYTIRVHALKSSSRIIGAMELGNLAEELEKAGNAKDDKLIKDKTPQLLEMYKELVEDIRQNDLRLKAKETEAKELITPEKLKEAYSAMTEIAQMFDYDSMMMVLQSLDKYELPEGERERNAELKEAVRKADWDEINSILAGKESR